MKKTTILAFLAFILLLPSFSDACSGGFRKGYGMSLNELITKTDNIVLATFEESSAGDISFVINETLKSYNSCSLTSSLNNFTFWAKPIHKKLKDSHISNDFNKHSNSRFWENKDQLSENIISRVGWRAGMCTPAFTFSDGEQYLLFLDSPGSFHAAEIIKGIDDIWYQYVLQLVEKNS